MRWGLQRRCSIVTPTRSGLEGTDRINELRGSQGEEIGDVIDLLRLRPTPGPVHGVHGLAKVAAAEGGHDCGLQRATILYPILEHIVN